MLYEALRPDILQSLEPLAYLLPTILLAKKVQTMSYKLKDGKFLPFEGEVVGHLPSNGDRAETIGRQINGGVAITKHSTLEQLNENVLYNPVTDDVFLKTKSGKGYFNKLKGIFVKKWNEIPED